MLHFWDNCVRGTRTQPLICVGCFVHYWVPCAINKRGFFGIAFVVVVDSHLPRFEALAYVLPHFDELPHVWFVRPQAFADVFYSLFVKRSSFKSLLNLRKAYIFQEFVEGLLSICVCWIFQKFRQPLCHKVNLPSCVTPQSKSTEMWSSAAPFHHDLWCFPHRTNEHFRSMLFVRKNL